MILPVKRLLTMMFLRCVTKSTKCAWARPT
jgi:hypothetical protein